MITIDGQDLKATWGIEPVYDGFYSALMKDAGMKDRITADYSDVNGLTCSDKCRTDEIARTHYHLFVIHLLCMRRF